MQSNMAANSEVQNFAASLDENINADGDALPKETFSLGQIKRGALDEDEDEDEVCEIYIHALMQQFHTEPPRKNSCIMMKSSNFFISLWANSPNKAP